jgi:exopolyphosphatase
MTAEAKVTTHDEKAVQYLESKIAKSTAATDKKYSRDDFFNAINAAKNNIDDLSIYDILRKDYKQWSDDDSGLNLGIASVVQDIAYLRKRNEDLLEVSRSFAKERSLDLFAIMTAFTSEAGEFGRELLLVAIKEGKAVEAAKQFVTISKDELQLTDMPDERHGQAFPFLHLWEQKNLAASRKQVAPLLRDAMRQSNEANGKL